MIGVDIVSMRLRALAPLTDLVPEARIMPGRLPEGVSLPVVLVRTVSVVSRQWLKDGPLTRRVDRVSALVRAEDYNAQIEIIEAMRGARADFIREVLDEDGVARAWRVSITLAGVGPDVDGPGNSFEQTRDFRVSFDTLS